MSAISVINVRSKFLFWGYGEKGEDWELFREEILSLFKIEN
jgi:hypothetical protein